MSSSVTASGSIDQLLDLSARYPLLTPLQEVQLGRAIRAWQDWPDGPDLAPPGIRRHGRRALDRFVCSNIRLAYREARRFRDRGVPLEDLLQSAVEGLIIACRKFRPDLGYRSSSYTIWWMRLACQQAVAQQGNGIRVPQTMHDLMIKMRAVRQRWQREKNGEPTVEQIAAELNVTPKKLNRAIEIMRIAQVYSLDWLYADGESENSLVESIGVVDPEPDTDAYEARLHLQSVVKEIADPQARAVIELLHCTEEPLSVSHCAKVLNISRHQVQQLESEAMNRLRPLRNAPGLRELVAA